MTSEILTIRQILEGVRAKNLEATILLSTSPNLWLHTQREDGAIGLAYGLPKETVAAKMMLYKNTKAKVHSLDRDTDYLNIVVGVLQRYTLAPYLFIICLDYVLWASIDLMNENGFKLERKEAEDTPRYTNYGHEPRRWHSASGKYTRPSRNPVT